jgi:hypothetical protein
MKGTSHPLKLKKCADKRQVPVIRCENRQMEYWNAIRTIIKEKQLTIVMMI